MEPLKGQIFKDPEFAGLSPDEQVRVLAEIDTDFASLDQNEQYSVVSELAPKPVQPMDLNSPMQIGKDLLGSTAITGANALNALTLGIPNAVTKGLTGRTLTDRSQMFARDVVGTSPEVYTDPFNVQKIGGNLAGAIPAAAASIGKFGLAKGAALLAGVPNLNSVLSGEQTPLQGAIQAPIDYATAFIPGGKTLFSNILKQGLGEGAGGFLSSSANDLAAGNPINMQAALQNALLQGVTGGATGAGIHSPLKGGVTKSAPVGLSQLKPQGGQPSFPRLKGKTSYGGNFYKGDFGQAVGGYNRGKFLSRGEVKEKEVQRLIGKINKDEGISPNETLNARKRNYRELFKGLTEQESTATSKDIKRGIQRAKEQLKAEYEKTTAGSKKAPKPSVQSGTPEFKQLVDRTYQMRKNGQANEANAQLSGEVDQATRSRVFGQVKLREAADKQQAAQVKTQESEAKKQELAKAKEESARLKEEREQQAKDLAEMQEQQSQLDKARKAIEAKKVAQAIAQKTAEAKETSKQIKDLGNWIKSKEAESLRLEAHKEKMKGKKGVQKAQTKQQIGQKQQPQKPAAKQLDQAPAKPQSQSQGQEQVAPSGGLKSAEAVRQDKTAKMTSKGKRILTQAEQALSDGKKVKINYIKDPKKPSNPIPGDSGERDIIGFKVAKNGNVTILTHTGNDLHPMRAYSVDSTDSIEVLNKPAKRFDLGATSLVDKAQTGQPITKADVTDSVKTASEADFVDQTKPLDRGKIKDICKEVSK